MPVGLEDKSKAGGARASALGATSPFTLQQNKVILKILFCKPWAISNPPSQGVSFLLLYKTKTYFNRRGSLEARGFSLQDKDLFVGNQTLYKGSCGARLLLRSSETARNASSGPGSCVWWENRRAGTSPGGSPWWAVCFGSFPSIAGVSTELC